ncbi:MAG TPA: hypothetical protein V6D48_08045 [Oculatellaceae cyanobacterium]
MTFSALYLLIYQYCIHQPETAIASLERVLDKERSLLSLRMRGDAIASGSEVPPLN